MTGLQDKVALVTGGSSGIGQAIAIGLGEEGASVAISYAGGPEGAKTRACHDPVERDRRAMRGTVRLWAAAIGYPGRRHGGGGDQPRRAAVRHLWLRRPDGTGVRRPPRNGRRPDAVGSAACGRGVRPGHRVAGEPGRAAAGRFLPRAGPASRRQRPARRLIGNNGPVSTARASSFLNCAGGVVARGGR